MTETNAMDTARINLRKVAVFARTAGLTELDCRKIIAEEFLELERKYGPETVEQAAVRESLEASWPAGCRKPNSCARNRHCMYAMTAAQCRHLTRDIGPEVDAESVRRGLTPVAGLGELAARENLVKNGLWIVTEDGTRLERNTGRPHVGSFHNGE